MPGTERYERLKMDKKIRNSAALFAGITGAYPRAMFKAVGYHRDELKKPVVGVVNSWSEMHPGRNPNKELAHSSKVGVWHRRNTGEFHTIPSAKRRSGKRMHYVSSRPRDRGA
jgi:dihydroxy-acid dehydratase